MIIKVITLWKTLVGGKANIYDSMKYDIVIMKSKSFIAY